MLKIISTRLEEKTTYHEAVIKGMSSLGGLYTFQNYDEKVSLEKAISLDYRNLTKYLFSFFADFTKEEIAKIVDLSYQNFDTKEVVNLFDCHGDFSILELYHGPTSAFKDIALQLLPNVIALSSKKMNQKIMILTATSGDTGKAALEGFKNISNVKICVFYPEGLVSDTQKRQMETTNGNNTYVASVKGNFDDCQRICKELFNDVTFKDALQKHNYLLSSANSINIGRLTPQIVYYFYAYSELVRSGKLKLHEPVNFVVPTGNFGNIFAGYIAKKMGLPINKLIIATNDNNVLYDFINTGLYDARRDLIKTISPSMDILVSSNVERLLYEVYQDPQKVSELMHDLSSHGFYQIDRSSLKIIQNNFTAFYTKNSEAKEEIKSIYKKYHKVIDPHTACATHAYKEYLAKTKDSTRTIILQTASPYKFSKDVYEAITGQKVDYNINEQLFKLTKEPIPENIKALTKKKATPSKSIKINQARSFVRDSL